MSKKLLELILGRLCAALVTLLIVSFVVFVATAMLPGNTAQILLGQAATPAAVAGLRKAMHLNDPAIIRYLRWLAGLVTGNLGHSYVNNASVASLIGSRLGNTLELAAFTTVISVPIAITFGILAAIKQHSLLDRSVTTASIFVASVPEFLIANLAVLLFAVDWHWLPALSLVNTIHSPLGALRIYAMPVFTLTCVITAQMTRMSRAAMVETLNAPYIEMALLKGASRRRLVLYHALPNAIGPIANAVALSLSYLLGGVIIVETVFNYPGLAKLMVDAVQTRDLPLIQGCAMLFCFGFMLLVAAADIIAVLANPRLR